MELHFPELEYDCLTCGKGCRKGWRIPVEENVRGGLEGSAAARAVAQEGYTAIEEVGGRVVLGHRLDGNCVFLRSDQLCQAHAELGLEAKPLQCQQFPFIPVNTPAGTFVGLSFLCSAVQRRHGRPAREHRPQVESLVTRLTAKLGGLTPAEMRGQSTAIALAEGQSVDWEGYLLLEEQVQAALRGDPYRGLWEACRTLLPPLPEEVVGDSLLMFAANLVALAEAAEPAQRGLIGQALMQGAPFYSARLGRELTVPLDSPYFDHRRGCTDLPDWLTEEFRRYLSHLVFRKFLLQGSTVLSQGITLLVLLVVLELYVRLAAGEREAAPDDLYFAFDSVEGELVTHADGVRPLFAFFEQALRQQAS